MLNALNSLFNESGERVICKGLNGENLVSVKQLKTDVFFIYNRLLSNQNTRWLLSSNDPYRFLVGLLALLAAEKTVVISANRTENWLNEITSNFDAILSDELGLFEFNSKEKFELNDSSPSLGERDKLNLISFSGNESLQFFTSGSTGQAKKVKKRLFDITNEIASLNQCFSETSRHADFLSSVSHFHIYGLLFNLFLPLLSKRYWVNTTIEFQEQLIEYTELGRTIIFISSPAFLSRLEVKPLNKPIAGVFSSGGPLDYKHANESYLCLGVYPIEVYGSTETGGIGYRQQLIENHPWQTFTDIDLIECPKGIELRSNHVHANPPIILDDKLELLDKGRFLLLGRKDRIVKLEEKRVSLNEIESFLCRSEFVSQCVALVIPGKRDVIGCVLILTPKGKTIINSEGRLFLLLKIKSFMRSRFESVTIPRKWRILDCFPVDSQGKLINSSLEKLFY